MSDVIPIQPNPVQPNNPTYMNITGSYAPYTPSDNPVSSDMKLSALFQYTAAQIRDTWYNMGQLETSNIIKVYTRNTVFRCIESGSPLNGCVFFCDSDYTVAQDFDWDFMALADEITGKIINSNTLIIDPHFTLVLSASAFSAVNTVGNPGYVEYNPNFVPFQESDTNCKLIIDDDELNRVLIDIGVPFIKVEELEFSREEIINLMIWPAVQTFYKWFPIETTGMYPLPADKAIVTMPVWASTLVRATVIPGYPIGAITNPMYRYFDEILMQVSPNGAYRTAGVNSNRRVGYQDNTSFATFMLERAVRSGIINYAKRTRIKTSIQGRVVHLYSTQRGTCEIVWGSASNLWSDIPFNRLDEVRKLAKAYVLRSFGALRMQAKSDIGTINYDQFLNRADKLEDEVLALWRASVKPVVIRM